MQLVLQANSSVVTTTGMCAQRGLVLPAIVAKQLVAVLRANAQRVESGKTALKLVHPAVKMSAVIALVKLMMQSARPTRSNVKIQSTRVEWMSAAHWIAACKVG